MVLETTYLSIDVTESDKGRSYWAAKDWASDDVRSADFVIVPWENFREGSEFVFPSGTVDFFRSFEAQNIGTVAIASTPDSYAEIMLHARAFRWPTILISVVALPALAGALGNIASDLILNGVAGDTVELEVIVEGDNGRCLSVKYKGAPDQAVDRVMDAAQSCIERGALKGS